MAKRIHELPEITTASNDDLLVLMDAPSGGRITSKITIANFLNSTGAGGYTDEMAQDAIGTMIADTATIDLTYTDSTPELKADVKDDSITYAKIQNVSATDRILGRITSGAGDVEELTAANVKTILSLVKGDVGLGNVDNTSDANKPVSTATQTALDGKVDENAAITGATKTKITYDAKGLVTAGADATTADIADSTNKRYVTDAQLTVIGNTSGTNTGDQTNITGNAATATALQTARNIDGQSFNGTANITVIAPGTNAATSKTTPIDADEMPLVDSAASNVLKKLTWSNLKATLKTYFDSLYAATLGADDNYVTDAEKTKLANLSGTNTGDQDLSGLVTKATYDAQTILHATSDNTPVALTVTEQTVVGRATGGNIAALAIDSDLSSVSANDDTIPSAKATKTALDAKLPLAGGTMTGNITLGENTSVDLDPAGSVDGKYSGIAITGTAGAALAFGDVCYLNNDDSRWELADANLSDGYDGLLGICVLAAGADGNATKMLLIGTIRADAAFPALTIGKPVYLSETAGDIVVAQPTTADVAIRVLGYALTADEIYFNPSKDYITHT